MDIIIREDKEKHMRELKKWLLETKESGLEEMSSFFSARLDIYEAHMSIWTSAYRRLAKLLPKDSKKVLDLGCGTGLELDEIFSLFPEIEVTGVDLCREMLDKLAAHLIEKETISGKEFMKILRAVQQGMDIPENLDDLVLSEDEKEVSNKQDTVKNAEDVTTVETEAAKLRPEMSGQNLIEVPQTPEKTEETVQATDTDHTETEEKPGSQA